MGPLAGDHRREWTTPTVARFDLDSPLPGNSVPAAVVWGVDGVAARALAAALRVADVPAGVPEGPWAAAIAREGGDIVAASSPTLKGGLCWSMEVDRRQRRALLVSHDVGAVVCARRDVTQLNGDFVRSMLAGFPPLDPATPYRGVLHLPPGTTAVWHRGHTEPVIHDWLSPQRLPRPNLGGKLARDRYLPTFDRVIDGLLRPGEPMASTLSGGLDSSFVVASMARHATPERPLHCFTHSPHPDAGLVSRGNWDPDDYEVARAMERAYPGRVVVHRVINEADEDPLEFLVQASARAWTPNLNPNGLWFDRMATAARELGASMLFEGNSGNAAFSYDHPYAAGYYLRAGDLRSAMRLLGPQARQGGSLARSIRANVISGGMGRVRHLRHPKPLHDYLPAVGLGWLVTQAPSQFSSALTRDREGYLRWLCGRRHQVLTGSPLAWDSTPVDPFASEAMVRLAASIDPLAWRQGTSARGFARLLGQGRVPDEIRLRQRRGSQSADLWYRMNRHRDRYFDELAQLPDTAVLGGWVDHAALRTEVEKWPWGHPDGPTGWESRGLLFVLTLAAFVRFSESRLREVNASARGGTDA